MSLNVGKILGGVALDLSELRRSITDGVSLTQSGAVKMGDALRTPFARAIVEVAKFNSSIGGATRELRTVTSESNSLASSLKQIAATAAGTAIGNMATAGLGGIRDLIGGMESIVTHGIQLAGQFETTNLAMRIMVGSGEKAAAMLKELHDFANTTPFEFPELANAAKQLLAMGVNANDIVPTLKMLGDVSAGLGQPIGDMAYLFGQIRSQGRAMTQDLNQFAGRGVPIYTELAKVLKTNELGVRALAEEGRIGFKEIRAAFEGMTSEGGKFNGMTQQLAGTASGMMSTLSDAWTNLQEQVGEAIIKGTDGKSLLGEITDEIARLTPTAVGFGVSMASAFANSLPYVRSALEYVQALAVAFGMVDLTKLYPDVYNNDRSKGVNAAPNTPESFDKLGMVQGDISSVARGIATDSQSLKTGAVNQPKIVAKAVDLAGGSDLADRMIGQAREAVARGEKLSDEQFNRLRSRIAGNVAALGKLQEAISVGIGSGNFSDPEIAKLSTLQERLRSVQAQSATALTEFEKIAQRQADTTARAKADKEAADKKATGANDGATPGVGAGGKYDLSQALAAAQVATLEAAGQKEQADRLRANQEFDREMERINAAHEKGNLNDQDTADARLAAQEKLEANRQMIRQRYADQRDRDAEREEAKQKRAANTLAETTERIQQLQADAEEARLREQGNKFAAEMVAFDAGWKRRIDTIKDAEEKATAITTFEAERRAKIREHEVQEAEKAEREATKSHRGRSRAFSRMMGAHGKIAGHAGLGAMAAHAAGDLSLATLPATLDEARRRVREAQAGSGKKEIARLDLRDMIGQQAHHDPHWTGNFGRDDARHQRLAERFGRGVRALGVSPLAGMASRLEIPRAHGSHATAAINAPISFDVPAATKALKEAAKAGTMEAMRRMANEQRDRNYANGVGGNL